jgi:hypothetical protein
MTVKEIRSRFEKEFEPYIKKGLSYSCIYPINKEKKTKILKPAAEEEEVSPASHEICLSYPFIFDARKLARTFLGFNMVAFIPYETIPQYFKLYEDDILSYEECWSPQRILAYAEENALGICEQLNDYTLSFTEICDLLAKGDFERYKKTWEEENGMS